MFRLAGSDFRAGFILSDGLNRKMAGGRERSLLEMCLPWAACPRGREDTMGCLGATPPAPSPGLGYNQDPQSGCLGALVLTSLVLASRATSLFLGRLSSAPLQSRGSAQHSEELFAVRHVPSISERIKKEAIKAPSSWLPVCWLTTAPTAARGKLCSAAKPCWAHGAPPCHPL